MVSAIALVTGASAAAKITQALDFLIDVAVAEIEVELEVDEVAGEVRTPRVPLDEFKEVLDERRSW
jgi:hypothetical protein